MKLFLDSSWQIIKSFLMEVAKQERSFDDYKDD